MAEKSMDSIIEKIELSAEIAQIALACHNCNGPVNNAINRFKKRKISLGQNKNNNKNSRQDGGSPFAAVTTEDGITTEVTTDDSNRAKYT